MLDRLHIDEAEIEITCVGVRPAPAGCSDVERHWCEHGLCARVLSAGTVKAGLRVDHRPRTLRAHVITLSDRAAEGVYADRSGPRLVERLRGAFEGRPWRLEVQRSLLPDDADALANAIDEAIASGIDLIFTTGGTGVGPRDIAPDVVTAASDKLIPGIMEHIRLTYGANKPAALLSRAVAGVRNRTLMYTLPGSTRAVDEYMTEIPKTLEHLIFTLHGVDRH